MLSRRTLIAGSAIMLGGRADAGGGKPLRFGIVADPQYADAPPNLSLDRHFANTPTKLEAAIDVFNAHDLSFVATLGDVIDRDHRNYAHILSVYSNLRHPSRFLLGNHDFAVDRDAIGTVPDRLGMPARHYDFSVAGVRFIVLDGNDVSLFAPADDDPLRETALHRLNALTRAGAINAKPWNGSLSDDQFAWLEDRLDAAGRAGERVVVLNHYPILPENAHNLWDADRLVELLTRHRSVVAYFNGHNHAGNYAQRDGVHFVNFRGMVDTPNENAFAIVTIDGDRIEIAGYGREPSRLLAMRDA